DRIHSEILPCLRPGGELNVTMAGDEGNDTIAATLRAAHMNGRFNLNATGGAGADDLFIGGFCPCEAPGAEFSIHWEGESGNDVLRGDLQLDPDSRGLIDIIFEGGAGDDDLTLSIAGIGNPNIFNARVDGGDGYDIAHVSRNMLVENCEEVFILE